MDTIPQLILHRFSASADLPAIHIKENGEFQPRTWRRVDEDVRRYASAFLNLGISSGDRVAQFSENRYEWIITDLALQLLGIVHVPIHATLSGEQVVHQVAHSGSSLLLVSQDVLRNKIGETDLPDHCLLYTSPSPRDLSTSRMPSSA